MKKIKLIKTVKINNKWWGVDHLITVDNDIANELLFTKSGIEVDEQKPETDDLIIETFIEIDGISESIANELYESGYNTLDDVISANKEELTKIKGIGKKSVDNIIDSAKEIKTKKEKEVNNV